MAHTSQPKTIGPYEVLERIGGGGMAEVFLVVNPGVQESFRPQMALKRILAPYATDAAFRAQFADEATLLARLRHPNIVSAFHSGQDGDAAYLVMEYVEGTDLANLLKHLALEQRRLPLSLSLYIARKVAAALAYAHPPPHRVVHRDVSPQNILLGKHGEVKLADFGIARFPASEHKTTTNSLVKGKLAYMSPEQIRTPLEIDLRSDLFSLGIVLYEMLTGRNPYKRPAEQAVIHAIVYEPLSPTLAEVFPELEPELVELVHKLLERDRNKRPQSAKHVLDVLRHLPHRVDPEELLSEYVARTKLPPVTAGATGAARGAHSRTVSAAHSNSVEMVAVEPVAMVPEPSELAKNDQTGPINAAGFVVDVSASAPTPSLERASAAPAGASVFDPRTVPAAAPPRPERTRWLRRRALPIALSAVVAIAGVGGLLAWRHDPSPPRVAASPTEHAAPALQADNPAKPTTAVPPAAIVEPASPAAPPSTSSSTPEATPMAPAEPNNRASKTRKTALVRVVVYDWGNVWLDDEPLGDSPVEIRTTPGTHRIQIGQGRKSEEHEVDLRPGRNRQLDYTIR